MSHSNGIEYSLHLMTYILQGQKKTHKKKKKTFPPTVSPEPDLATAHVENCFPITDNCGVIDMTLSSVRWKPWKISQPVNGNMTRSTKNAVVSPHCPPSDTRCQALGGWGRQHIGRLPVLIKKWATDRRRHLHCQVLQKSHPARQRICTPAAFSEKVPMSLS